MNVSTSRADFPARLALLFPCSIVAENDISRYPQTYTWGFISHEAAGLPNALVRTSPQTKQVHALPTHLLHTSTLVLVLLLLAVLSRPLYVLKVAQTIVKKGKGEFPPCPLRIFSLLRPFMLPYWTRPNTWPVIPPCLPCRLRFRWKTMPLLSAETPAHIWAVREHKLFAFRKQPNANFLQCSLLKKHCQG